MRGSRPRATPRPTARTALTAARTPSAAATCRRAPERRAPLAQRVGGARRWSHRFIGSCCDQHRGLPWRPRPFGAAQASAHTQRCGCMRNPATGERGAQRICVYGTSSAPGSIAHIRWPQARAADAGASSRRAAAWHARAAARRRRCGQARAPPARGRCPPRVRAGTSGLSVPGARAPRSGFERGARATARVGRRPARRCLLVAAVCRRLPARRVLRCPAVLLAAACLLVACRLAARRRLPLPACFRARARRPSPRCPPAPCAGSLPFLPRAVPPPLAGSFLPLLPPPPQEPIPSPFCQARKVPGRLSDILLVTMGPN